MERGIKRRDTWEMMCVNEEERRRMIYIGEVIVRTIWEVYGL